jgi:hypothetical protein
MESAIIWAWALGMPLIWLMFHSWFIARLAFHQFEPTVRAGLTAGAALVASVLTSILFSVLIAESLLNRGAAGALGWYDLAGYWTFLPAALLEFFILRRGFRRAWSAGERVEETFA